MFKPTAALALLALTFFEPSSACLGRSGRTSKSQPPPSPPSRSQLPQDDKRLYCKDDEGRPVSWFMAYKLGHLRDSPHAQFRLGLGYLTLTPGQNHWRASSKKITDPDSILRHTIDSLWQRQTRQRLHVLYSDQPPARASSSYNGHMKGIIMAGFNGGFWLQHSLPKFPLFKNNTITEFTYPENGDNNAQLFYCMSLSTKNLDQVVGNTLMHARPIVYDSDIPKQMVRFYPLLNRAASKAQKRTPANVLLQLVDRDLNLTIFAKGPKFEKDIYADWIAPHIGDGLKVQSWLTGANSMPSNCKSKKYQIMNVVDKQIFEHKFSYRKDHSKWAVSHKRGWTCISDLNRMESQKLRGGASICTKDVNVWNSFHNSIIDVQPCPRG